MESDWYYERDGTTRGPCQADQLLSLGITPETLVWRKGMAGWCKAKDSPAAEFLFGLPPPSPIETPAAPPASAAIAPPIIEREATRSNYIVRHWRGELSLAQSYWVNVFLLTLVSAAVMKAVFAIEMPLRLLATITIANALVASVITVWQIVGFYRSLREHIRCGGSGPATFWSCIALLILVVMTGKYTFVNIVPQCTEMFKILTGDPDIPRMTLTLMPSGKEVEISGGLPAGCAGEFEEFMARAPSVRVLQVDCIGGRLYEATQIAKVVAAREMTTFVSGQCLSAATLVFLAGKSRYAHVGAKIGFHAGSLPGVTDENWAAMNAAVEAAVVADGVKPGFAAKISQTPSSGMWYPTVAEMLDAGVIEAQTTGERFEMSTASAKILANVEEALLASEAFAALKRSDPAKFEEARMAIADAVADGASEAMVLAGARKVLMEKFTACIPTASNQAYADLLKFYAHLSDSYADSHPLELCAILNADGKEGPGALLAALPGYPLDEENHVLAEFISSGSNAQSPVQIDTEAAGQWAAKLTSVFSEGTRNLLDDMGNYRKHPKRTAAGYKAMFTTIRQVVPEEEQGNLWRYYVARAND